MIQTKTNSQKTPGREGFPKLMQSSSDKKNGLIVLFFEENTGVPIANNEHSSIAIGQKYTGWKMDCFYDYPGEVTLSNAG